MDESYKHFGNFRNRVSNSTEFAAASVFVDYLREKNITTPDAVAKEYFHLVNVEPRYTHSEDVRFEEDRERLNSEPGVFISNHPGVVDAPLLLGMITRTDVLALAGKDIAPYLSKIFGESTILCRTHDPNDNLKQFRAIKKHVENGGLFFLFPTGGEKIPFMFRDGFRVVVEKILRPTDMVYSTFIEPRDIQAVAKNRRLRNLGALSTMLIPDVLNPLRRETRAVRVDEHYSQANEWKRALMNTKNDNSEKNQLLTRFYLKQFGQSEYPWPEENND